MMNSCVVCACYMQKNFRDIIKAEKKKKRLFYTSAMEGYIAFFRYRQDIVQYNKSICDKDSYVVGCRK